MATIDKKGILHGPISNLVFRNYGDTQVVQSKPRRYKQKQASKESALEFGLCCMIARVIRGAFMSIYEGHDAKMVNRLNSTVRKCINGCKHKERGDRDMHDADLSFLQGFQFNNNSPMDKALQIIPKATLDADRRIRIEIPPFSYKDIKGRPSEDEFVLKFTAIGFDLKKGLYCFSNIRDIDVRWNQTPESGPIVLEEEMPPGRIAMLGMSIHAYIPNRFSGKRWLNSAKWSPSELIGAWHVPAEETADPDSVTGEIMPARVYKDYYTSYQGDQIFHRIKELREKK